MKKENDNETTSRKRLFPKTRGGERLIEEQVREIKEVRKKLKKQMKEAKVYSKKEFELTASSMGLYFDKNKALALPLWFLHGRGLAALLASGILLLSVLFLSSLVTQMRGHFTINLSDDMFRSGFVLSETVDFSTPTSMLYSKRVEDAPCISIAAIPADIGEQDGDLSTDTYLAYSFYVRYESDGDDPISYTYDLKINSEGQSLSQATWAMLYVDGRPTIYAKAGADGQSEALPSLGDDTRGYRNLQLADLAANPEAQFQIVKTKGTDTYYRILPENFLSEEVILTGMEEGVKHGDVHKYTVVLWLEGDDPDCTDELIGGHLGVEMNFRLLDNRDGNEGGDTSWKDSLDAIWKSLRFWGT